MARVRIGRGFLTRQRISTSRARAEGEKSDAPNSRQIVTALMGAATQVPAS
jgi:hypothetical protein